MKERTRMIAVPARVNVEQICRARDAELIRSGRRITFTAHYEREDSMSWFIQVPEIYASTHSVRFDEIEPAVRDLVVATLHVEGDAFDVRLERAR
jgi:hypothetical protein